jgi:5'-nucleotidase / UDP-sugar diphosphatase
LGGFARRAKYLEEFQKTFPHTVEMLVDAGDFSADVAIEAEARNRWMLEGMSRMNYAAINIGELETLRETDRWQQLEAGSPLPYVSANAVIPPGSRLKPTPYAIREIERADKTRLRVALMGLTVPSSNTLAIEFADPVEKARQYVTELTGRYDVLVVLAQMPLPEAHRLAQAVPDIDILIGAEEDTDLMEPEMEGHTLICYPYPHGMGLGDLRLFFDADGHPARFFYRVVPLAAGLGDHPDWVEFQRQAETEITQAKSQ